MLTGDEFEITTPNNISFQQADSDGQLSQESSQAFDPRQVGEINTVPEASELNDSQQASASLCQYVIDRNPVHLRDFVKFASMPAKSSKHEHVMQMLVLLIAYMWPNSFEERKEIACPNDYEYTLIFLKLSIITPELMKFIIPLYPPFHAMKHGLESIEVRPIFQMLIKAPLAKLMRFKAANKTLGGKFYSIAQTYYNSDKKVRDFIAPLPKIW